MVIETAVQTYEYHMMTYASINSISLGRLLFDPTLIPLTWFKDARAPVTWKFWVDELIWTMLDPFRIPPTLKTTWKSEQQTMEAWENFVFRQIGDSELYSAFPFSAFHPPSPLNEPTTDIALEHPFLNPEKAKDVDKWVGIAEEEGDISSPTISSPSGIAQLETSGLSTSSVVPPEPVVQQSAILRPAKVIPGIKKRMPLIVEPNDAQLTPSSVVRQDDPPPALLIPSLDTEPPKSIEIETKDQPSGDSARPNPIPSSSSSQASHAALELPKLQTMPIAILEDHADNITQKQAPLETAPVVSITSKSNLSDLLDLSWEVEAETHSDLPVSPGPQHASLSPSTELLIADLESPPEDSRASKSELQASRDLLSENPPSQTPTPSEPIESENTPSLEGLLPEPSTSVLGHSQNFSDLLSLCSEAETAIATGSLSRDPLSYAPLGDQTDRCEDLLTDIEETGHPEQAPEAADQSPDLLDKPPVLVTTYLVSSGSSTNLLESGSIARNYLLSLFPEGGPSDQTEDSPFAQPEDSPSAQTEDSPSAQIKHLFGTDGSFDNVPQLELPRPPALTPDSLRKKYALAALARGRPNQRALLDKSTSEKKEHAQPSLRTESTATPKKEVPSADTEQAQALFGTLKRVLDPLTCWPGVLSLEVQLGLILLPGGPKKSGTRMELNGLKRFMAPPGLACPSVTFFERLTTCPGDMDHVVDLQHDSNGASLRLFEKKSWYAQVLFEFHCECSSSKFIITVFENGSHVINPPEAILGALYLNFPSSVWDAALKIRGEIIQAEENEEIREAALSIAKNLWIEPNRSHVRLLTRRPKHVKIVKILMKRSTEHRYWKSEYPYESSEEEMYLRICETQDLIIQVTDLDDEVIQAHCNPLPEMTKANRQWWTASFVSSTLNLYLNSNKHLKPGEKTDLWTPADLFGSDAKFLVPTEPGTATLSSAPTRPSGVATAIGGAGISGLVRLAEKVIRKIDAVGWNSNGPASGLVKGSSSNSKGPEGVSVVGDKKTGASSVSRLALVPVGRNYPAPIHEEEGEEEEDKKGKQEFW